VLVAVVGPPGVGKSTVIRSLVHHYTGQNLTKINGPITVVSGPPPTRPFTHMQVERIAAAALFPVSRTHASLPFIH
jgi:GTPase SAR1 family protein